MNLAIIITISHYKDENFNKLKATENDFKYMSNIIEKSNKYKFIKKIKTSINSEPLKEQLTELIENLEGKAINEVFVYFSGHGYYDRAKDEFYYCVSDTKPEKIETTAISNTFLDNIVRNLNPKTYVKIIDACNSGINLIKGVKELNENEFSDVIYRESSRFENCFFLSSSKFNQASYTEEDNSMSAYTKCLLKAIYKILITDRKSSIKYVYLINVIGELFMQQKRQTPRGIIQSAGNEIFINKNDDVINYLKNIKNNIMNNSQINKKYELPTKEKAISFKNELIKEFINQLKSKKGQGDQIKLKDYKLDFQNVMPDEIYLKEKIGQWIKNNKTNKFLFAEPKYEIEYKFTKPFRMIINTLQNTESVKKLSSFEPYIDKENCCKIIKIYSIKNEILPIFQVQIVTLFNANKVYLLYNNACLIPKNWSEYGEYERSETIGELSFVINSTNYKARLKNIVDEINLYMNNILVKYIEELELS